MKLIILGSGTCVPSLKRNAPGYYLEAGDSRILIDCGSGTLLQLEKAGRSYSQIDAVFITHKHPDHFADLMPLIHALMATPKLNRKRDLHIFSPKGFNEYYEASVASVLGHPKEFSVRTVEIQEKLKFGPFNIITAKTIHSKDSVAYRFECGGQSIVFTGDADYEQGVITLARDADLIIADCSYPDSMKAKGHLSAKECGLVAAKAGAKKLVLSHLYPADSPDTDRIKESGEVFKGEITLAEDLMIINI